MNIREIANLAGVSVSTVSKIINRKDDNISDETRQKVLAIVKQYHYRPYASAQAPCNTNTFLLGAIMNASCRHPELWEFIGKCVSEKGYSLVLCHAKNPEEELRSLKILQGHHVAGVIWDKDQSSLPECRSVLKGVPVKEISCYEPPGMQNCYIDYGKLAYLATESLIKRGHKQILCVLHGESFLESSFLAGYQRCLFDYQISFGAERIVKIEQRTLTGKQIFENTGAVCFDSSLAAAVYESCHLKNRRIPKYMSVVALCGSEKRSFLPELSVFPLPYRELAEYVCTKIIADVENRRTVESPFVTKSQLLSETSIDIPLTMRNKKIVVVGSANMDTLISLKNFPNAGETALTESRVIAPGGKGLNQAVGVAKLGGEAHLIARVGKDYEGGNLFEYLQNNEVNIDGVTHTSRVSTGHAYVYVRQDGESSIVVYKGANGELTTQDILQNEKAFENASFCLLQTEVRIDAVEAAANIAYQKGVKLILKPSAVTGLSDELLRKVYILMPNEREISKIRPTGNSYEEMAEYFLGCGVENVIITLGSKGCFWKSRTTSKYFPAEKFDAVDTTGAADIFAATLAIYLSQDSDMETAIRYATLSAGFSTTKIGATASIADRSTLEFYQEIKKDE